MRALITGAGGFVGGYLQAELSRSGWQAVTTDIRGAVDVTLNLLDAEAVGDHLAKNTYDAIFHLAGFSSVHQSWKEPERTFTLNLFPTLHLLESLHQSGRHTRMLVVGSSDQYGLLPAGTEKVSEDTPRNPQSPYAISKNAQEQLAATLAVKYGLDVLFTRSFNHIGPGQERGFVVSDFASAIAGILRGAPPVIYVGNTSAYRDFTDVRDVVRAYRLLVEKGVSGEIYNVGSGSTHSVREILDTLILQSHREISVEKDPGKYRPVDQTRIVCDPQKLQATTGWTPEIPLAQSLQETLSWWEKRLGQ